MEKRKLAHGLSALLVALVCAILAARAPGQQNPLAPEGFKPPPPKTYDLPKPDPNMPDTDKLVIKKAASIKGQGKLIFLKGGVEFQFRGYNIKADEAEGNTDTEEFILKGNVIVRGADQVTTGDIVWVDLNDKLYRFDDGNVDFSPQFFNGSLLTHLYAGADRSDGSETHQEMFGSDVTTCPVDHYELSARQIDIDPEERVIFRHFHLSVLRHTLLGLPHFILPLNKPTYNGYVPDIGRSELEGVYAKSKFDFSLVKKSSITAHADLMQKRGFGTGLETQWKHPGSNGGFNVYNLYDTTQKQNTFTGQAGHNQKFGKLSFNGTLDARMNSYLSFPGSKTYGGNLSFRYDDKLANSQLAIRQSNNSQGPYVNDTRTATLTDSRPLRGGLSIYNTVAYTKNTASQGGTVLSEREQADLNLGLRYAGRSFDGELAYLRSVPIGNTTNFFGVAEQTPMLSLHSDTRRLLKLKSLPVFNLDADLGHFVDNYSDTDVTKYGFGARTSRFAKQGKGLSFGYTAEFAQAIYSDDTAQYIINTTTELRYGLDSKALSRAIVFRYRYTRPYGFTPLAFDQRGEVNNVSTLMEFKLLDDYTVRVGGGYDYLRERKGFQAWNTVGAAMQYKPADWLKVVATSTYDPNNKLWQNTRIRVDWKPGATTLMTEARYDAERHVWGNLNFRLDGLKIGRLRASLLFLYNGYTRQFETQQVALIYDLHCAEAILTYANTPIGFRRSNELQFNIRIKAFPYSSNFGIGPSGQPLDTSTGVDF